MSRHEYRPRALLGAAVLFASVLVAACGGGSDAPATGAKKSFVYATAFQDQSVLGFSIDSGTGRLSPVAGSPFPDGVESFQALLDPSGKFLYVANCGVPPYTAAQGSNISAFAINPDSGALTRLPGSPFLAGDCVTMLAFSKSGAFLYALNSTSNDIIRFSVDATTGMLTRVGAPVAVGQQPQSIAVDPSGKFAIVANGASDSLSVFAVDATTGALTPVPGSPFAAGDFPFRIAFGAGGKFVYVETDNSNGQLLGPSSISGYRLDPTTGSLTQVSGSPFALPANGYIATNAAGTALYLPAASGLAGYAIDQNTGALAALPGSPYPAGADPTFVTIEPTGQYLFMSDCAGKAMYGYTIAATGALTPISGSPFAASSCTFWTVSF